MAKIWGEMKKPTRVNYDGLPMQDTAWEPTIIKLKQAPYLSRDGVGQAQTRLEGVLGDSDSARDIFVGLDADSQ